MADNQVICPFCGEKGFDLIGLKTHFERGWCHEFTATKPVGYLPFCGNRPTSTNTQSTATKLAQIATRLEQRVATDGLMTLEDRWQTVVMDAVHQLALCETL